MGSLAEYLRMGLRYAQLDIDYSFAQMCYLLIAPRKVGQLACYRKQTKNQWSRDDPAFVVLQVILLFVSCIGFALAFRANLFRLLLWSIGVHYLLFGVCVSTVFTYVCNQQLRVPSGSGGGNGLGGGARRQVLEWRYAWDMHCNGFVPVFICLYVVQLVLLPLLYDDGGAANAIADARSRWEEAQAKVAKELTPDQLSTASSQPTPQDLLPYFVEPGGPSFVACLLSNTLFAISLLGYFYVSSLGYAVLPFLENTDTLLYPAFPILFGILLLTLFKVNLTSHFVSFLCG